MVSESFSEGRDLKDGKEPHLLKARIRMFQVQGLLPAHQNLCINWEKNPFSEELNFKECFSTGVLAWSAKLALNFSCLWLSFPR